MAAPPRRQSAVEALREAVNSKHAMSDDRAAIHISRTARCELCGALRALIDHGAASTISRPRSMPIWQLNGYSPASVGASSTAVGVPSGSCALLPKPSKTTISEQGDASSRWKISRSGLPATATIVSGV